MTRPLASSAVALACALVLAACGGNGDATGPAPAATIAGVYPLVTYNGATLPITIGQNDTQGKLELTSGHVTLNNDGTFNEAITYRLTPAAAGAAAVVDSLGSRGRYAADGARLTFTFPDGEMVTARHENGTITIVGQATFVYRR